jgi:ubiquitin-like protein Pup
MAEQEYQKRQESATRTDAEQGVGDVGSESAEQLKAELDDILDQIDEVLEENAEEFVRNYVQKGGE